LASSLAFFLTPSIAAVVRHASQLQVPENLTECRSLPEDSSWPTATEWNDFNKTLGGRLIATKPIASSCHLDTFEAFSQTECSALQASWTTSQTHISSSSSIMAPFFANYSCDPFAATNASCVIGTYVQYAVNASDASHYIETLQFVSKHNIRLTIRNTGHDYYGKATGAGAVAIWTHHLKDISFLDYNSSSYTGKAIKVGAGVDVIEALTAASSQGLVVVGGNEGTVGFAGGYTQGGGHGQLASQFGLAADQALEWEVVTAQGKLVKATPTNNSDLYWALSGGGGGTYGVVLSLTSRAHPDERTASANLTFTNAGVSQSAYWEVAEAFVTSLPTLVDAGAASIWLLTNESFSMTPTSGLGLTKAELDNLLSPVISKLKSNNLTYTYVSEEFPTFLESFVAMTPASTVDNIQIGGRFIPRSLLETSNGTKALVAAMQDICNKGGAVSGVALNASKKKGHIDNAVNPAWRTAVFHAVLGTFWDNTNHELNIANQRLMTNDFIPQLERLTPGGGAYLNEANFQQPDWQQAFYGKNYDELKSIKSKYDPESRFYGLTAVGSDSWTTKENGRLCRV